MFVVLFCFYYMNVQTGSHTVTSHLSIYTHELTHAYPNVSELCLQTILKAACKALRKIIGRTAELFGLFPHFPLWQTSKQKLTSCSSPQQSTWERQRSGWGYIYVKPHLRLGSFIIGFLQGLFHIMLCETIVRFGNLDTPKAHAENDRVAVFTWETWPPWTHCCWCVSWWVCGKWIILAHSRADLHCSKIKMQMLSIIKSPGVIYCFFDACLAFFLCLIIILYKADRLNSL